MIRAAFEKFWAWLRDVVGPNARTAYADHELVRHVVTFAVGALIGWVFL